MANINSLINDSTSKIKENFKTILMYVGVCLVSLSYPLYSVLGLEPADYSWTIITVKTIVGMVTGILIKMGLGEVGFDKGYKDKLWLNAKESYKKKADKCTPYTDKLDDFQEKQIKLRLEKRRRTFLQHNRIKYNDFFDENGDYINRTIYTKKQFIRLVEKVGKTASDYVILDKHQQKALKRALDIIVLKRELLNEYDEFNIEDDRADETENQHRTRSLGKNLLSIAATTFVGTFFTVSFIWDNASFFMAVFQVCSWLAFGILQLYNNYQFVTNERAKGLKKKENDLDIFLIEMVGREEVAKSIQEENDTIELTPEQALKVLNS